MWPISPAETAAQALREAAAATYQLEDGSVIDTYRSEIADWLESRAKQFDAIVADQPQQ